MSSVRLALAVVAVVALGLLGYWLLGGRESDPETVAVRRGSIDVTIQTVGTLQATAAATVRSPVAGAIKLVGAALGDDVITGDIIAVLDAEPFDTAIDEARRNLEQAEYRLQLAEQQAANSPDDPSRRFEVLAAGDQVQLAEERLADVTVARHDATILATRGGTVIELLVVETDVVSANQVVARIAAPRDLTLVADVDELDLPNITPGAEARFRLSAFPAEEVVGTVVSTAPQARQQGGATVFETEIEFTPPAGLDLRPGMNAAVTIVTAARDNVLLIPDVALRTIGDRAYVDVVTDDGTDEREIVLGYRAGGQVEVVSGLMEGERVVLR